MSQTILLHSGGMDSHVCWLLDPTLKAVYVRHGARNEQAELDALEAIARLDPRFQPTTIDLGFTPDQEFDGHVAHRNALLLIAALAAFPEAESITYGALLGEGSGDKSAAFTRHLAKALSIGEGRRIRILRPLRHITKAQALRRGLALPGGHTLTVTTSCLHGDGQPQGCERCQSCFRLGIAQYLNGLRDDPPGLPTETKGVVAALRANKPTRWPSMAAANIDVVRAYGLHQLRRAVR